MPNISVVARELYPIVKIRQMRYSVQIKDHENLHQVSMLLGQLILGLIRFKVAEGLPVCYLFLLLKGNEDLNTYPK